MVIYDISQEVFGCTVFPGDPPPTRTVMLSIKNGDICNLTGLSMCAHNGTHVDAPYHFVGEGRIPGKRIWKRTHGLGYANV